MNEKRKKQMQEWRKKNREKDLANKREYYLKNKEHLKAVKKQYYADNKEKILANDKLCKLKRKDELKEYRRAKNKERYANDINFKIKKKLKARLYLAMKNNYITGIAIKNLGCSIEELRIYLQSKFEPDMTWDNYGKDGWHIDHIKPLALFDLTNEEQLKEACNYKNLQPLWAEDNFRKNDNY